MSDNSRIGRLPAVGIAVVLLTMPLFPVYVQPTFVAGVDSGIPTAELESFPNDIQRNLTAAADTNQTVAVPAEAYPESFPARIGGNPLFDSVRGGGLVVGDDVAIELEVEKLGGGFTVSVTNRTADAFVDPATLPSRSRAIYTRAIATDESVAFYTARLSAFRNGVQSHGTATFVIDRDDGYELLTIMQGPTSIAGIGLTLVATLGGVAIVPMIVRRLSHRGVVITTATALLVATGPVTLGRVAAAGVPPSGSVLLGRIEAEFPTVVVAAVAALMIAWQTSRLRADGNADSPN